jgi:cell division protein FtsA
MENMIASGHRPDRRYRPAGRDATDIAEAIFNRAHPAGRPRGIGGLVDVVNNPMYATGVGLVIYGAKKGAGKKFRIRDPISSTVITRMKKWFKDVI